MSGALYHIGFGVGDLDPDTTIALLSGDPGRSERIAHDHLAGARVLSRNRGLDAFGAALDIAPPGFPAAPTRSSPSRSPTRPARSASSTTLASWPRPTRSTRVRN